MITAVDSSVLIDIFRADPDWGERSAAHVRRATDQGRLIVSDVAWAEVVALFEDEGLASLGMDRLGVDFEATSVEAAIVAGRTWRRYRKAGGSRSRLVADFLIGAHAQVQADRLLTRDRGFYRRYFADLAILDPST